MNGMIILQLIFFYALFTLMVKIGVGSNALNGLYFYPEPVRDKVYELGPDRQGNSGKEAGNPDTDLDCRGGYCCRNRCATLM